MIDNLECKTYPELADFCQKLLKEFRAEKITQQEFDREICYTSLKYGFDELAYRESPRPPQVILAYRQMEFNQKKSFLKDNDWFFREGEAADYLNACSQVDCLNHRNYKHLLFMLDTMEFDPNATRKIQEKVYQYEDQGGFNREEFRKQHHCQKVTT